MDKFNKDFFVQAVYEVVCSIPYGRATSYGAIAKAIGYPNMSRMVGQVMAGCGASEKHIPAHRVVNSQGILSAKEVFGTAGEMQRLLEAEGVVVINDRIKNWKSVFWDPIREIEI